jgi:hypothetical protein
MGTVWNDRFSKRGLPGGHRGIFRVLAGEHRSRTGVTGHGVGVRWVTDGSGHLGEAGGEAARLTDLMRRQSVPSRSTVHCQGWLMPDEVQDSAWVEQVTRVLQKVVCPRGLSVGQLAQVVGELGSITMLERVQSRIDDPQEAAAVAATVTAVVSEAVERLGQGPTRQACERLLGVGATRGLPRRNRRRAAREVLDVGEEHFRKNREYALLRELAAEIVLVNAGRSMILPIPTTVPEDAAGTVASCTAKHVVAGDRREAKDEGSEPRYRRNPRRRLTNGTLIFAAMLTSMGIIAAVILLHNQPQSADSSHNLDPARRATIPTPVAPSVPRVVGDQSVLVEENYPDGVDVKVNEHFVKSWELRNAGSVPWRGRYLQRIGSSNGPGLCSSPARVPIARTLPNQDVAVTVEVIAPSTPSSCRRVTWKMVDVNGNQWFPNDPDGVWFDVNVVR